MNKNDLEIMCQMLESAQIVFKRYEENGKECISIEAKEGPKNEGYVGFVAVLSFKDGKLDTVGVWE